MTWLYLLQLIFITLITYGQEPGPAEPTTGEYSNDIIDRLSDAGSGTHVTWSCPIPYTLDPTLSINTTIIIAAMNYITSKTGWTFVARTIQSDYINFYDDNGGCRSFLGRIGGGQRVYIDDNCPFGTIIHEIGHAIGIEHEQSRLDRDAYVNINFGNIISSRVSNFDIRTKINYGDYDYNSIMHYNRWAFANDTSIMTITAIGDTSNTCYIGQRGELSDDDIIHFNNLIGAGGACNTPPYTCNPTNIKICGTDSTINYSEFIFREYEIVGTHNDANLYQSVTQNYVDPVLIYWHAPLSFWMVGYSLGTGIGYAYNSDALMVGSTNWRRWNGSSWGTDSTMIVSQVACPTPTSAPITASPTSITAVPTDGPTELPTVGPTNIPTTGMPTLPTIPPTIAVPTMATLKPIIAPTINPSIAPTIAPSFTPSLNPTLPPSMAPSIPPSTSPTFAPSFTPTSLPTPICHCAKFKGEMIVSSTMNRNDILWGGDSFVSDNCRNLLTVKKNGIIILKRLVSEFINPFEKDENGNYIRNINDPCAEKTSRNGWEIGWNTTTLIANHSGEAVPKLMLQDGALVVYEKAFKNVPAIESILLWRSNDRRNVGNMILRLTDESCLMLHKYGEEADLETSIWYKCFVVENDDTDTTVTTFTTSFYDSQSFDDERFDGNTNGNISASTWWIWLIIILLFLFLLITFIYFKRYLPNKKLVTNVVITSAPTTDKMDPEMEGCEDGDMETTVQIEQWIVETNDPKATVIMQSSEVRIKMQDTNEPKVMSN